MKPVKNKKNKKNKTLIKVLVIINLITIGALFWSKYIEPQMIVVKKEEVYLPNWSPKLNNLKVGLISDLHIGCYSMDLKKLNRIVDSINSQNTDFTFLLGDFDDICLNQSSISPDEVSKTLTRIKTKYGKIAVLGNHDYSIKSFVPKIIANANIQLLENSYIKENVNNQTLYIAGIKDLWLYPQKKIYILSKIKDKKPIIFLSHNPDIFPQVPEKVSISLAGHLHGGVVLLPFFGGLATASEYDQRFLKGLVVENGKHYYITSGVNAGPFSFNNLPEVVVLTLKYPENSSQIIQNTPPKTGVPKGGNEMFVTVRNIVNKIKGLF